MTSNKPNNILIFKPGAIGDLLHITPVINALKTLSPHASITLVVNSKVTASLFVSNPSVDEVLIFNKFGDQKSWAGVLAFRKLLKKKPYDLLLNYQRSNLKGWIALSGALPCKVLIYHKMKRRTIHAIVDHLRPLAALGIDPYTADRRLDFFPSEADESVINRFMQDNNLTNKRIVAFNPGTSAANKCWPVERFAQLGDRLSAEYGCSIVVVGSKDEAELATAIRNGMQQPVYDLCGCSLGELGAVLKHSEFLVTGDTGPMHISAAVGTPVLALYGPISPVRSGPEGEKHRIIMHEELDCCPCNSFQCKNKEFRLCMELITVDEVVQAAAKMLQNSSRS